MKLPKFLTMADIHIAVFGDTGSGKTILLSTFYAHQNDNIFEENNHYKLLATDQAQDHKLIHNYYGLEKEHKLPEQTNKNYEEFKFQVNVKGINKTGAKITWYDYPGEWWRNNPSTNEEIKRRKELFQKLVNCDVALLLVDGYELKESQNKSACISALFRQFTNEIQRQFLMSETENNIKIPKTWIICLTKSDLLDNYTCNDFKKDVHGCAATEYLRQKLQEISSDKDEISLGDYFLKLSAAKIDIDGLVESVGNPIGIDLIAPIAIKIPLEYLRTKNAIKTNFFKFMNKTIDVASMLSENYSTWFAFKITIPLLDSFLSASADELQKQVDDSLKKKNAVDVVVTSFMKKLKKAEEESDIYLSLRKDIE